MNRVYRWLLCMVLMFGLSACGGGSEEPFTMEDLDAAIANGETVTLEQYISATEVEIQAEMDAIEQQGLTLEVLARDNKFVYSYTYLNALPNKEEASVTLEAMFEPMNSIYESIYAEIKAVVPELEAITLEYNDQEGDLIATHDYTGAE